MIFSKYKWYKCKCHYCGKPIEVKIEKRSYKRAIENEVAILAGNACYDCVPENSRARNGIDESYFNTRDDK